VKSAFITYLKQLFVLSAIISLVALAVRFILPGEYLSPSVPFLIVFFMASSILSFHFLLREAGKRFIKFVNAYLLTVVLKLILYVLILIAYAFFYRSDAVPFMLGFLILYLCYTIFESVSIIRYSGTSGHEDQNSKSNT
jgi:hypothetical protein